MAVTAEPRKLVATFLALTTVFAAICYTPILRAHTLGVNHGMWVLALMWSPGVAGLITRLVWQHNLRGHGWGWGPWRYPALAYVLPPLACVIVYGLVWVTGFGGFSATHFVTALGRGFGHPGMGFPMALLLAATVGFVASMTSATGEELGWRGVLVPELSKFSSFTKTSLVTGVIWAVYHYPAIFFTNYHAQGSRIVSFAAFTVLCFAACVILTWLRLRSGSVWPAAIFHASHNLFVQDVFDQLTISKSRTEYVTTEFGVGLAIVYSLVALWLWRRRHEVAASVTPVELHVEASAAAV